jgi:hypothetical protein
VKVHYYCLLLVDLFNALHLLVGEGSVCNILGLFLAIGPVRIGFESHDSCDYIVTYMLIRSNIL